MTQGAKNPSELASRVDVPTDLDELSPEAMRDLIRKLQARQIDLEQKIAELDKYRLIVSTISDPISYVDKHYTYHIVNSVYVRHTKKPRDEILGSSVADLLGEEFFTRYIKPHLDRCLEGERTHYQAWFEFPDEALKYMDVWHNPVFEKEGRVIGAVVIARDVTDLKRAEDKLRESEERLRFLVASSEDIIVMQDREGRYLYYNGPARYGLTFDQVVGRQPSDFWESPRLDRIMDRVRHVFATGEAVREEERAVWNGELLWFSDYVYPVRDAEGNIVAVGTIARNITEFKHLEEQLRTTLQEKEAMMMEIHHRVRNSLQVIINLLTFQANHTQDDTTLAVLRDSRRRVKSMAMIHEQLYQVANFTEVDLAEYIPTLATNLLAAYRANLGPVTLKLDLHETVLDVEQAVPCGLIISELVSNTLRHAFPLGQAWPEGFVGEIRIALRLVEETCILSVSDNGIGLSKDFNFPDESTLGMFLIKTFAEQLNATVSWDRCEDAAGPSGALYPGTLCRIEFVCR